MKNNLLKKYIIKIPYNVNFFFDNNNIITFIGPLGIKSIKLKVKIIILNEKNHIIVTKIPLNNKVSFNKRKYFKLLQKTFVTLLKQIISEVLQKSKKKLKLIGIGFRATVIKKKNLNILHLKLGYSHQIFISIPKNLNVICPKTTKILIFGNCQKKVNKLSSFIRLNKIPEPYKGKGIFYENEKIILKEGKKI